MIVNFKHQLYISKNQNPTGVTLGQCHLKSNNGFYVLATAPDEVLKNIWTRTKTKLSKLFQWEISKILDYLKTPLQIKTTDWTSTTLSFNSRSPSTQHIAAAVSQQRLWCNCLYRAPRSPIYASAGSSNIELKLSLPSNAWSITAPIYRSYPQAPSTLPPRYHSDWILLSLKSPRIPLSPPSAAPFWTDEKKTQQTIYRIQSLRAQRVRTVLVLF